MVANQEVIPTGERSGIYPLPRPRSVPSSAALGPKEGNPTKRFMSVMRVLKAKAYLLFSLIGRYI